MSRLLISMLLSGLVLLIAAPTAFAEPNLENGKTKFVVCEACHMPTGSGSKEIGAPRIAGQNPWYEKRQLQNFKAGIRGTKPEDTFGAVMRPMALTLPTDQDIVDKAVTSPRARRSTTSVPRVTATTARESRS
jgi:cytochrome c553